MIETVKSQLGERECNKENSRYLEELYQVSVEIAENKKLFIHDRER
jgi:hypothetical protein